MGGSLGSRKINHVIRESLTQLTKDFESFIFVEKDILILQFQILSTANMSI